MKNANLESGRILVISTPPFKERQEMLDAVLVEVKGVKLDKGIDFDTNFIKDMICTLLTSKRVTSAFRKILGRCTLDGDRITEKIIEQESYAEDYVEIFSTVVLTIVSPFLSKVPVVLEKVINSLDLESLEMESFQQ